MRRPVLPKNLNNAIGFAKELVKYLGENPKYIGDDWCWSDLYKRYPHLRPKVESYLETCKRGNVADAIYKMVRYCGSSREWAEKQLETCQYGDVADAIYKMVYYCESSREWAEKQLETCQYGDVADAIYKMVYYCESSREWAEKQLETCQYGNVAMAIKFYQKIKNFLVKL